MTFSKDLKDFQAKANLAQHELRKAVAVELFSGVISDTPVDTGRARANWQATTGSPFTGSSLDLDKQPLGSPPSLEKIMQIESSVPEWDGASYLTNNLPYINALEFGGYPDPVKKGTYIGKGKYEIRSSGGYSKQAPNGMVRKNLTRFQDIVRKNTDKFKV